MDYDVCIIGGGPAGYLAGIRAAQLGAKTVVVEMDELGGVCTNRGCIPTKALLEVSTPVLASEKWMDMGLKINPELHLETAMSRMNDVVTYVRSGIKALLTSNKVNLIKGKARFIDRFNIGVDHGQTLSARFILVATGSIPSMPKIDGIKQNRVYSSDGLFTLKEIPERIAIIGGGAIGIEYATILKSFGAKKVIIVEYMDRLLPFMDPLLSAYEKENMEKLGIEVILSCKASRIHSTNKGIELVLEQVKDNKAMTPVMVDSVFVATGRAPNTAGIGLEEIGVSTTNGWINVNMGMRTSVDNVYAAGDVNGIKLLAHAAFHQGMIAVENMLGAKKFFDPILVPSVVYSKPPVAQVGMDEANIKKAGIEFKTGIFDLENSSMAIVHGEPSGFVKILSDKKYGRILGASIAGEHAYELVSLFTTAIAGEITVDEIKRAVFAHPSFSEAIGESAWAVDGLSQHTIKKGDQ
ncbi:MAG: dihydrolipoyl dehydrogenase [bacterium]